MIDTLPLALDLTGTFVFALSGAVAGVNRKLDLFGVLVLSFAAATAGGIGRDVLIGAIPPAAVNDWRYLGVSLLAGVVTFYFSPRIVQVWNPVLLFDAAGLALFSVAGAAKALSYGLNPLMAIILGMLTGIGGGMVRDILLSEIPHVLRADLYAMAALAGAAVVVVGRTLELDTLSVTVAGLAVCFFLRFMGIKYGWRLPIAKIVDHPNSNAAKRDLKDLEKS